MLKTLVFTPYTYFVILRFFMVFTPQTGYIHPDEFFQSVEILAGKIFHVDNSPPWEFNTTFPIRSMAIPYFTIGMSYKLLRDMNYIATEYFGSAIVTPYFLLVIPRLVICLLSLIVDYSLFKICVNNNEKYHSRLLILSSSYVILVYGVRTFSNTIEMILFSGLLYFVSESVIFSNTLNKKRDYINYRYKQSKTVAEKAKFHKLRLYLTSDSYRNCFIISTITVMGFFNRPTFLAFAVMPVFFWIYRGIGNKSVTVMHFHTRILFFTLCSLPSFLALIVIDSFYYGYLTWGEIGVLDISLRNFLFTPLNFIKYNVDASNLVKHGLHPRFLHALVNIPLLFNVLGICLYFTLGSYLYLCIQGKPHLLPSIRSIKCLMILSVITPVGLLSIFPHQEPRFLIPVILPLIYLHGTTVLPESETAMMEVPKDSLNQKENCSEKIEIPNDSHALFNVWLLVNTLLGLFFGYIQQGGIYPAVTYLKRDLDVTARNTEFYVVTSHIYSLPESFLLQKKSSDICSDGKKRYSINKRVFLFEEGSMRLENIVTQLGSIIDRTNHKKRKVYLLISSSLRYEIEQQFTMHKLRYSEIEAFFPHVSVEAFPDLSWYCLNFAAPLFSDKCKQLPMFEYFSKLYKSFQLILYEVGER